MAVPRKFKKQLKKVVKHTRDSEGRKIQSSKRTWTFVAGDLVKCTSSGFWGVVIDTPTSEGYVQVLMPGGNDFIHASKLERVQKTD